MQSILAPKYFFYWETTDAYYCYQGSGLVAVLVQYIFLGLVYVVAGFILLILFKRSKAKIEDGSGMKRDLRLSVIIWTIQIPLWGGLTVWTDALYYFPSSIVPATAMFVNYVTCTLVHLRETYLDFIHLLSDMDEEKSSEFVEREDKQRVPRTFEEVLRNPEILEEFRKFLTSIYAVENLIFIERIDEWKKTYSDNSLLSVQAAVSIYNTFLSENSPMEVYIIDNVLSPVRTFFDSSPQDIPITVFDELRENVIETLESDCFGRFFRKMSRRNTVV
jgi:hypothetical protein